MEPSSQLGTDEHDVLFAKRMIAAGINPAHRIGIAVSGGPDSTALCILLHRWLNKVSSFTQDNNLVAFVVDHGLRTESRSEASLVQRRVSSIGIQCEVLQCTWANGRPTQGRLQEAAREARYRLLEGACRKNKLAFLLTAHHADDQIELFIIRLSRHSGLPGLAGIPFVSEMFRHMPDYNNGVIERLLLVRPLLDFKKEDLYEVCRKFAKPWVEDPTNENTMFLRNYVRKFLVEPGSYLLKMELGALSNLCREVRIVLDKARDSLLLKAVSVNHEYGYATLSLQNLALSLNLQELDFSQKKERILNRLIVAIVQFVIQKEKPPRSKGVQILIDHLCGDSFKGSVCIGGCIVCMDPSSMGRQLIFCNAPDPKQPVRADIFRSTFHSDSVYIGETFPTQLQENLISCDSSNISLREMDLVNRFVNVKETAHLIEAAKVANILSENAKDVLMKLVSTLSKDFHNGCKKAHGKDNRLENSGMKGNYAASDSSAQCLQFPSDHICYFMNKFFISWGQNPKGSTNPESTKNQVECRCLMQHEAKVWIRCMDEKDWVLLSNLTKLHVPKTRILQKCEQMATERFQQIGHSITTPCQVQKTDYSNQESAVDVTLQRFQKPYILPCCFDTFARKAHGALSKLKSLPIPARRGLPVFVNAQGALLGIPNLRLDICPNIWASSRFCPKVPLGGGFMSWQ